MVDMNKVDESIRLLRELQTLLFDENSDNKILFSKTVEIYDMMNKASVDYNRYLNEKNRMEKKIM